MEPRASIPEPDEESPPPAAPEPRESKGQQRAIGSLALLLAVLAIAYAVGAAWRQGSTYDESNHIGWSLRFVEEGNLERASSQLFNSKTPISVPNALAWKAGGNDRLTASFLSRLPTVVELALLLAAGAALGRRLGGPIAGALTLAALALDPNLRAHGSLATVDAVFALATLLVVLAGLRFAERPNALAGLTFGGALGLAVLAKLSGLWLAVPAVAGLPLACPRPEAGGACPWRRLAAGLTLGGFAGWSVLALGYGLHGLGGAQSLTWRSGTFRTVAAHAPRLLELFPSPLLTGIDASLADERQKSWNVFALGRMWPDGVPWYFALTAIVKTPLALLVAAVAGIVTGLRHGLLGGPRARYVAAVLLFLLGYFSLFFRTQLGYRYVLMCLPLGYALAAAGGARLLPRRRPALTLAALSLLAIVEQARFGLDPLAFTNSLVWDKSRAFEVVADSNLDWGQNDRRVRRWAEEQGPDLRLDPADPSIGINVFSANFLLGILPGGGEQEWLRAHRAPDRTLFFTHLVYRFDRADLERYLDQARRLVAGPRCALAGERLRLRPQRPSIPVGPGRLCLRAERITDVRLEVGELQGGKVGWSAGPGGACRQRWVAPLQSVRYRLEPGSHTLCAGAPVHLAVERGAIRIGRRGSP